MKEWGCTLSPGDEGIFPKVCITLRAYVILESNSYYFPSRGVTLWDYCSGNNLRWVLFGHCLPWSIFYVTLLIASTDCGTYPRASPYIT